MEKGRTYEIEGLRITYRGGISRRGIDAGDVMRFLIAQAPGVAAGAFLEAVARRVYRLGRKHVRRLVIDGREVEIEEEDILEVLRKAQGMDDAS